jgi:hypothetical protein
LSVDFRAKLRIVQKFKVLCDLDELKVIEIWKG